MYETVIKYSGKSKIEFLKVERSLLFYCDLITPHWPTGRCEKCHNFPLEMSLAKMEIQLGGNKICLYVHISLKIVWFIKYLNKLWSVALGYNNEHWSDLLSVTLCYKKFPLPISRILNNITDFICRRQWPTVIGSLDTRVEHPAEGREDMFPLYQPWQVLIRFFWIDKHIHLVGKGPLVQTRSWWDENSSFHVIYLEKLTTMLLASYRIVTPLRKHWM